jgi:hypothetical protein
LLFFVGLLNAINVTDGANGSISSVVVMENINFYGGLGGRVEVFNTANNLLGIYNMISGKLFFGNAEVYSVGALC